MSSEIEKIKLSSLNFSFGHFIAMTSKNSNEDFEVDNTSSEGFYSTTVNSSLFS